MAAVRSLSGRTVIFRLSDIPERELARGCNVVLRNEDDFSVRLAVGALVDDPSRSTRTYQISVAAWKRVMRE